MYHQRNSGETGIPNFVRGGSEYRNVTNGMTPSSAAAAGVGHSHGHFVNSQKADLGGLVGKRKRIKKKGGTDMMLLNKSNSSAVDTQRPSAGPKNPQTNRENLT